MKTYSMLTKDNRLAVVPRQGNHVAAARQTAGYTVGMTLGVVSAILVEPLAGLVKDTHEARGFRHGWVAAHHKVDGAKQAVILSRTTNYQEALDEAATICAANKSDPSKLAQMSHYQLCRFIAQERVGQPFTQETDRAMLEDSGFTVVIPQKDQAVANQMMQSQLPVVGAV